MLITTEGDEMPISLDDLGPKFKEQQKTECGIAQVLSANKPTPFIVIYDHLGFTKHLRMNAVASVLTQKDIRGHAVIIREVLYKFWMKQ